MRGAHDLGIGAPRWCPRCHGLTIARAECFANLCEQATSNTP